VHLAGGMKDREFATGFVRVARKAGNQQPWRGEFFFPEGDARVLAFLLAHRIVEQMPE
jgi:hypothetical protein